MRVDALSESDQVTIGLESRHKVEERIRQLEGRPLLGNSAGAKAKPADVYHAPATPAAGYNAAGDSALGDKAKKDKGDKGEKKSKKRDKEDGEDGEKKAKKSKKDK